MMTGPDGEDPQDRKARWAARLLGDPKVNEQDEPADPGLVLGFGEAMRERLRDRKEQQ